MRECGFGRRRAVIVRQSATRCPCGRAGMASAFLASPAPCAESATRCPCGRAGGQHTSVGPTAAPWLRLSPFRCLCVSLGRGSGSGSFPTCPPSMCAWGDRQKSLLPLLNMGCTRQRRRHFTFTISHVQVLPWCSTARGLGAAQVVAECGPRMALNCVARGAWHGDRSTVTGEQGKLSRGVGYTVHG